MNTKSFESFIEAINKKDLAALGKQMTENHRFIDSVGAAFEGRQVMTEAWKHYFAMFPDYQIYCQEIVEADSVVIGLGECEGTYAVDGQMLPQNHWKIPAVWRAVIEKGKVREWRVYADNEPVRRIMEFGLR